MTTVASRLDDSGIGSSGRVQEGLLVEVRRINFIKVLIMLAVKITATIGFIALLRNVYGAPLGGLFTMLAGLAFGASQLGKYMDFSIPTILKAGFLETIALGKKLLGRA